ncbi:hypothetical protein AB834_00420 [PVC group bacterium (ex Bugula neritina AB1)]|nr:hypothetical protein AB834_00420 [PVC group bacterium (ex Bugula neritina AB1)]
MSRDDMSLKIKELEQADVQQKEQIALLKHENAQLKRLLFSARSERHVPKTEDPAQLELDFGELAPTDMEPKANLKEEKIKVEYERRKKKHVGRHPLPEHLPVEEIRIEPENLPEDAEQNGYVHIADTIVETLEYTPGSLFKKRYILPRYVKTEKDETGAEKTEFFQATMPSRPLPKSIAESGLLTHLITQKFLYHLPFYRQIKQFKELYETELRKSSVNDWFVATCTLLKPLYEKLKQKILESNYLQADESPIQVQDNDKKTRLAFASGGKTHRGYQWVYQDPLSQLVLFDYQKGRGKNGPKAMLSTFTGVLQTDGYAVYDKLIKNKPEVMLIGCAAHARRYFFDAKDSDPKAEIALNYFQKVYTVERQIREIGVFDFEKIAGIRTEKALPVWKDFFAWAKKEYPNALPKSPFGKALYYLLQREQKLTGYCRDGKLQIDNNLVENSIRPLALGRKNYLFAGSHDAAQRIAMMYSFFGSCHKQGINPVKWLKYVLDNIAQTPINRIEELLPNNKSLFDKL